MYNAAVLPSPLNSFECSSRSWKKKKHFYTFYWILGIDVQDGIPDVEVLRRSRVDCYFGSSHHLISPFLSFAGETFNGINFSVLQEQCFMVIRHEKGHIRKTKLPRSQLPQLKGRDGRIIKRPTKRKETLLNSLDNVACSRLQDSGGKSFSKKKCEKRAGAGGQYTIWEPGTTPRQNAMRMSTKYDIRSAFYFRSSI